MPVVARWIAERILSEVRAAGYARTRLDVLPEFVAAQQLYELLEFASAEPMAFNPVSGTKFLSLGL